MNVLGPTSRLLIRHAVELADQHGRRALTDGELLAAAERKGFDVLLAADTHLRYQQNLTTRRIAVVTILTDA